MLNILREIWKDLGRSILIGERYEKNMRGIKLAALLIVAVNLVTGGLNLINRFYSAALTAPLFILACILILYFTHIRGNRTGAVVTALIAVVAIFTYEAFTVQHGFTIFWTLLLPMAFCYFASVRAGIGLSLYFLLLYGILFMTPLHQAIRVQYSEIITQRFPILYLADVVLTAFIMIQYHRTTQHQMDYAAQLSEAKKAADRANEAKSDFLANMSHEIRTPINAVLGMNEMILRESEQVLDRPSETISPKVLENIRLYAGDVRSAGNSLLAIINDILDFSKIEANRMEIVRGAYQFSSVLNDVSNMFLFKAREKGLAFTVDVDESIPDDLIGDEIRVRQVITNLLNNAIKYTRQGSVSLSVRREEEPAPAVGRTIRLIITVRDTGIGIREKDLSRIFTKFERVDLRQNSTIEGTGLGLTITQRLVSMMGGDIRVESKYGEGSVFTVQIPQEVASAEPVGNFRERFERNMLETREVRISFRAPEAHILVVDDTRMNLTVVRGLLQKTEIRIDTANSGAEAIDLACRIPYDLILMDQRMPEMDGTEALHRIRAEEDCASRQTPVICLTADAVIGAKEKYLADGFTDYLTKPIDSTALAKMLIRYLPAGKMIPEKKEEDSVPESSAQGTGDEAAFHRAAAADDGFTPLREAGIQPETGLSYCQGDEALYRTLLREYAQGADEKIPDMERSYREKNWKGYAILVHALKSSSRMIGAENLADLAARLEREANQGQEELIREKHSRMIGQYEAAAKAIRIISGEEQEPAGSDEDILEFLPEGNP